MNFLHFFLLLCVTFALLDSVPDSADQNHCESMQIRIPITDLQVQILPCSRAGSGSNILVTKYVRIQIPAAGLPDGSSDIVCRTLQPLCFPSLVGTVSLMSWIRNIKILQFSRTGSVPDPWHFGTVWNLWIRTSDQRIREVKKHRIPRTRNTALHTGITPSAI